MALNEQQNPHFQVKEEMSYWSLSLRQGWLLCSSRSLSLGGIFLGRPSTSDVADPNPKSPSTKLAGWDGEKRSRTRKALCLLSSCISPGLPMVAMRKGLASWNRTPKHSHLGSVERGGQAPWLIKMAH